MAITFEGSDGPTLGIEMELEVVDRDSRELAPAASELISELSGEDEEHPKVKHELLDSTVEVITGINTTVADGRRDIEATLAEISPLLPRRNLALMCAGSHPFSQWHEQGISPGQRYADLMENFQWMGRRLQICGIHFHVGVRSGPKAISILNSLSAFIPHFLSLSASSPYWGGHDTGLASARSKVFEGLPTAGLPYILGSWEEFQRFMSTLISADAIHSVREVWWDIRPHPGFGTIELRICDGVGSLDELASLAALAQSLVTQLDTLDDRGFKLPVPKDWILRQNKWRAARYGIDAQIIVDDDGRLQPLTQSIAETVDELMPVARRLKCADELHGVLDILNRGPSYMRQRAIVADGGSLTDVVDSLTDELGVARYSTGAL